MPEITTEPVQSPADQHVEPSSLGVLEQSIQSRPRLLSSTDATVHEFRRGPAPCLYVAPEFLELVFRLLVEGGNASVNGGPHRRPPGPDGNCSRFSAVTARAIATS